MASGTFKAQITPSTGGLAVEDFVQRDIPSKVGVCLSGGGSRALSAGMGQLRALAHLTIDGEPLLSRVRALSTVSGGSWVGVTFEYLADATSDEAYLNGFVEDPGRLVPTQTAGHDPAETLDELPDDNVGNTVSTELFSVPALALEGFLLYKLLRVPPDFLWQALIGLHILRPYGLYRFGRRAQPSTFFTWDGATREALVDDNPSLDERRGHVLATGSGRVTRPYLACNTALFLQEPGTPVQFLAPVQATPFWTGVVGSPRGTDANGREPGGGGVTSFAMPSNPTRVDGEQVDVTQERQLALADVVGSSSAAFAETVQNKLAEWRQHPEEFLKLLEEIGDDVWDWIRGHLERAAEEEPDEAEEDEGGFLGSIRDAFGGLVDRVEDRVEKKALDVAEEELQKLRTLRRRKAMTAGRLAELKSDFEKLSLKGLIPEYAYWPAARPGPYDETNPTRFADGGSLENTGVAALLAYSDVERLISCVNSTTPLAPATHGAFKADGTEIPGTRVMVASQIPPLFGYQAYDSDKGYRLYEGDDDPSNPLMKHSKVFPSECFADLLKGLWEASGNKANPGSNQRPAVFKQARLPVQDNDWFGTASGRDVTVVWVYTNRVRDWYDALSPEVQQLLGDFDDPSSFNNFPHYGTFDTDLSATEINLLAHLTAWTVAGPDTRQVFLDLFRE